MNPSTGNDFNGGNAAGQGVGNGTPANNGVPVNGGVPIGSSGMPVNNGVPVRSSVPIRNGVPVNGGVPVGGVAPVNGAVPMGGAVPVGNVSIRNRSAIDNNGDIVLASNINHPKKKRTVVVAATIIFLVLIIAFIVVYSLIPRKSQEESGLQNQILKQSLNKYVNYVISGNESEDEFNYEYIFEKPYFTKLNYNQIDEYSLEANNKYKTLLEQYADNGGFWNLVPMKNYYQEYPMVKKVFEDLYERINNTFIDAGRDQADQLMNEEFNRISASPDLDSYMNIMKKADEIRLDYLDEANNYGCISSGKILKECFTMSKDLEKRINENLKEMVEAENTIRKNALRILSAIYREIYGEEQFEGVPNE